VTTAPSVRCLVAPPDVSLTAPRMGQNYKDTLNNANTGANFLYAPRAPPRLSSRSTRIARPIARQSLSKTFPARELVADGCYAKATLWGNNLCVKWWYPVASYGYVQSGSLPDADLRHLREKLDLWRTKK
jgi:hypothetical protein